MSDGAEAFAAEALPENRNGHLTSDQAQRFQRMVSSRSRSTRGLAIPVGAIGVLVLHMSGPATTITSHLTGWGFLVAAAVILVSPAFDALAADVREGRVETVQGAIGKRRVQSTAPSGAARYYLKIGDRELRTYRSAYDQAPDAGYVRAFYFPRTRRLVNLEHLPNPPLPAGPAEARQMFGRIARAFVTGDSAARAEALANAAGLIGAARETIVQRSDAPSGAVVGGLMRETLAGKWTHPLATVTFAEEGTATVTTIMGATQSGHWSVDGHGRLLTDITGTMEPTDAALDDGRLTIQVEGRRLTFTRATDA